MPAMHAEQTRKMALRFAAKAPVAWEKMADNAGPEFRGEMAIQLLSLATETVRAGAYLDSRAIGQDHAKSVRYSNQIVNKVRKAFGFAYPRFDINF